MAVNDVVGCPACGAPVLIMLWGAWRQASPCIAQAAVFGKSQGWLCKCKAVWHGMSCMPALEIGVSSCWSFEAPSVQLKADLRAQSAHGQTLSYPASNSVAGCAPQFLLTPGVVAARCLALKTNPKGGGAYVELDLRTPIEPLSFTYEHAPVRSHCCCAAPAQQLVQGSCRG